MTISLVVMYRKSAASDTREGMVFARRGSGVNADYERYRSSPNHPVVLVSSPHRAVIIVARKNLLHDGIAKSQVTR